jgi:hypothetical protein
MKWILTIQALSNKFTSEIQYPNSITIKMNGNPLKYHCFTTENHISPDKNTRIFQLAVSGKQQVVACFNYFYCKKITVNITKA